MIHGGPGAEGALALQPGQLDESGGQCDDHQGALYGNVTIISPVWFQNKKTAWFLFSNKIARGVTSKLSFWRSSCLWTYSWLNCSQTPIYQWSIDYSKHKFKVHGDVYTLSQCFVWITIPLFNQLAEFLVAYFRVVYFPANIGALDTHLHHWARGPPHQDELLLIPLLMLVLLILLLLLLLFIPLLLVLLWIV